MIDKPPAKRKTAILVATVFMTADKFLRDHVVALNEIGYRVHLVVSPNTECDAFQHEFDVTVHQIRMNRGITPVRDLVSLVRLWILVISKRPKLLHYHTPKAGLLGSLAGFFGLVPIRIFTFHGIVSLNRAGKTGLLLRLLDRLTCALSTSVWCVSNSLLEEACSAKISSREKTVVLGDGSVCGVDLNRFNRSTSVEANATKIRDDVSSYNGKIIGFVGRINIDKGILVLLAAFEKLLIDHKRLSLLIVGGFDSTAPLTARQALHLKNHPSITIIDHQSDVVPFIAAMDIVVLPSYREGFGMVCIEANALGIPVVASNITGIRDAIEDHETGILVPAGNATALSTAISKLLDDPTKAKRLGANGRNRVKAKFSKERIASLVREQYLIESGKNT